MYSYGLPNVVRFRSTALVESNSLELLSPEFIWVAVVRWPVSYALVTPPNCLRELPAEQRALRISRTLAPHVPHAGGETHGARRLFARRSDVACARGAAFAPQRGVELLNLLGEAEVSGGRG